MKPIFKVDIQKFATIQELPNSWNEQDYKNLLDAMEYGDVSEITPQELKEMCMLSLTDNETDEAALIVLNYVFGKHLNDGQKQNLSHEMLDEKMWEEYADLSMHERFFNIGQLLYQAYNGKFPHPEAVKFRVCITAKNTNDLAVFKDEAEAPMLRLLTKGMPDNTLLKRLFKDQLNNEQFTQAKDIIWQLHKIESNDKTEVYEVISSAYWFHDLKLVDAFEATTHADEVITEK